jgi:hypothetical protein
MGVQTPSESDSQEVLAGDVGLADQVVHQVHGVTLEKTSISPVRRERRTSLCDIRGEKRGFQ